MNWHDTIVSIRKKPEYADLVRLAYFDENLPLNVERFGESEEFLETLKLIKQIAPQAKSILDIGAGNGISSINFVLKGYDVTVVEPDPSDSVGANAIRRLQQHYKIKNLTVYEEYAENIGLEAGSFDIVYVRQAMHHAYDLGKFIKECARVLKPGGTLLTIRDHVIFNDDDKEWFLLQHPLHKFYGGENAFKPEEYRKAITDAGLKIIEELKFYSSVINYFPLDSKFVEEYSVNQLHLLKTNLKNKVGPLSILPGVMNLYKFKNRSSLKLKETDIPGRMYSYISQKA